MKKEAKIFIGLIILVSILIFIFYIQKRNNIIDKNEMDLKGNLIMSNPFSEYSKDFYGAICFDLENNKYDFMLKDYYVKNPVYNFEKNKLLFFSGSSLFEYNIKTEDTKLVITNTEKQISNQQYVPNSNCISYILGNALMIYDLKANKEKYIIDVLEEYSWSNDGKSFLFDQEIDGVRKICSYNIENGTEEVLFDGSNPIYSQNNQYIAYISEKENKRRLIVRNISTNAEKEYVYSLIRNVVFSPNSDKLAIVQESIKNSKSYELIIWDFNLNKKCTYIELVKNNGGFDWK